MANNLLGQNHERVGIRALAAAVASGSIARQSGIVGIPIDNAATGTSVSFAVSGLVGLTFAAYGGGTTVTMGSKLYWDVSAAALSVGAADEDVYIGYISNTKTFSTDGAIEAYLINNQSPYGATIFQEIP